MAAATASASEIKCGRRKATKDQLSHSRRLDGFCPKFSPHVQRDEWDCLSTAKQAQLHCDLVRVILKCSDYTQQPLRLIQAIRLRRDDPDGSINWDYFESFIDLVLDNKDSNTVVLQRMWSSLPRHQQQQLHADLVEILLAYDDHPDAIMKAMTESLEDNSQRDDSMGENSTDTQVTKTPSSYWFFATVIEHLLVGNESVTSADSEAGAKMNQTQLDSVTVLMDIPQPEAFMSISGDIQYNTFQCNKENASNTLHRLPCHTKETNNKWSDKFKR
jgi:hypothetical protein